MHIALPLETRRGNVFARVLFLSFCVARAHSVTKHSSHVRSSTVASKVCFVGNSHVIAVTLSIVIEMTGSDWLKKRIIMMRYDLMEKVVECVRA